MADYIESNIVQVEESKALCVLDAFKTFSPDTCVLSGLNMNVPLGSM